MDVDNITDLIYFSFHATIFRELSLALSYLLIHDISTTLMKSKYAVAAAAKSLQSSPTLCDPLFYK